MGENTTNLSILRRNSRHKQQLKERRALSTVYNDSVRGSCAMADGLTGTVIGHRALQSLLSRFLWAVSRERLEFESC